MTLTTLIPPCYNKGDKIKTIKINSAIVNTKIEDYLEQLEIFAGLSNMKHYGNVHCSYNKEKDEALLIIADNTISALTYPLYNILKDCTGTILVKGRINRNFNFSYTAVESLNKSNGLNTRCIDLSNVDIFSLTAYSKMFEYCDKLQCVIFDTVNASKIKDFADAIKTFRGSTIKTLDLRGTNFSDVTINNLFKTSNIETVILDKNAESLRNYFSKRINRATGMYTSIRTC